MAGNNDKFRNANEASVHRNLEDDNVLSEEEFIESLLCFFRNGFKNYLHCRERDQSELVRLSWVQFQPFMKEVRHEEIYVEMLFSVFEIFPFTKHNLIHEVLESFVLRKVVRYRFLRSEFTRDLPLIESPVNFIHYYADPLQQDMYSTEKLFSPALLFDISVTKRLVRYGARLDINPLQTRYCMNTILGCLTFKLLPEVYGSVQWESLKVNFGYPRIRDQRRLYWVLLLVYVMVQSKKPKSFPKWRSYMESLKLLFKACTEPFITAQEIDRFLRTVTVGEFDKSVSEDLCSKYAEEFPRIKEPSTPRSLKQLSRCRVRECLTTSKALPHGVWYLDIPMPLKSYLLLQENFDEFYPEYVLPLCSRKRSARNVGCSKRAKTSV